MGDIELNGYVYRIERTQHMAIDLTKVDTSAEAVDLWLRSPFLGDDTKAMLRALSAERDALQAEVAALRRAVERKNAALRHAVNETANHRQVDWMELTLAALYTGHTTPDDSGRVASPRTSGASPAVTDALRLIGNIAEDSMEGAGMPEFAVYDEIACITRRALGMPVSAAPLPPSDPVAPDALLAAGKACYESLRKLYGQIDYITGADANELATAVVKSLAAYAAAQKVQT
jgi:hypothetical protein